MKNRLVLNLLVLSTLSITSCNNSPVTQRLFPNDFETDNKFVTFADTPPVPTSIESLNEYKELGMTACLLTEDQGPMVESDGTLKDSYKEKIRNIGSTGMEVWIRNMYNDPDYFVNDDPTKVRSNYGVPYSLNARNITTEFKEFPEVTGFYMADEPYKTNGLAKEKNDIPYDADYDYSSVESLAKLVDWFNDYYGDGYAFHMNHVPSSSHNHWTNDDTYRSFLEYYVDTIVDKINDCSLKTVSLDNYPFQLGTTNISTSYLTDLLTAAMVTRDYNKNKDDNRKATFGFCIQTFEDLESHTKLRAPSSKEEISYQLYTGISLGARQFEYFLYRSIGQLTGILDANYSRTPVYDYVKEANELVLPMEKVMYSFEWQNFIVNQANDIKDSGNYEAFDMVKRITDQNNKGSLKSIKSRLDAGVGYFTKGDQEGYFVTNQDSPINNQVNTIRLTFDNKDQALVYHEGKVTWQKLLDHSIQLDVKAGDGYFIIPA